MSNRLVEFFPFLSTLLRTSEQKIAFVCDDCKILYASDAFAQVLQSSAEDLIGRDIFELLEPESVEPAEILRKRNWQGPARLGGLAIEVSFNRTAPMGGKRPGIVIECTSAAQTETPANHQRTQLESLGVLSCGVAHDINNILAGILGHVSFLRLSLPLAGSDQESLETIEQGTRKAAQLTRQVLEFAQGQQIQSRGVHFGSVVADAVKLIQTSVPKGVTLETSGLEEALYVLGDEGQLSQLILNLTVNARDAVGESGTIRIEIAPRLYDDPNACADLGIEAGEYLVLSVRDTGPGIEESIRAKIFEPFFTTKEGKGTGLGLATVNAIVAAHRGLLIVDSAPGQGTCFEIALPQAQLSQIDVPDEVEEKLPPCGSEKVLIVDDEDAVRMIMEKSLEHLGYEVITATNGTEALAYFAKNEFKLVILDMIMPGMAGDEVFEAMRQMQPAVSVLIASGYASDGRIRTMLSQGALGYIQKPFSIEELAEEVRRCIDSGTSSTIGSQAA